MASTLIVDDEEALQTSLVTAFSLQGYRAEGAGSGREALQLLKQARFDVVLVDLRMPDIDGIQVMERVREDTHGTVVILMTGGATVEIAPDLPPLRGDGEPLRLVFFNLVENAIKFNEPGGDVAVQAGEDDGSFLVSITNTRGQIPAERIPRLLEPFTQGDMSATRAAGGLGLGLAVVRLILDAHGGQLAVESGQGSGTTVRVRLPLTR